MSGSWSESGRGEKSMHDILVAGIPGIKDAVLHIGEKDCPFKMSAFFAVYTKSQMESLNYNEISKCFNMANDILRLGCPVYRNAIENVYLFSVARHLDNEPGLQAMLPHHLKKVYRKISSASGV